MQKKEKQEKSIVAEIKDKMEFFPNQSYGIFKFNTRIRKYMPLLEEIGYDYYKSEFFHEYTIPALGIELWVSYGVINTVFCEHHCIYKGYDLIKMGYTHFTETFQMQADEEDYLPVSQPNGRYKHEKVYDFNELGLQIWVWRGKIVTVMMY